MADDELLEDGDLSEANFELDLAEEDALLADDGDESSYRSLVSANERSVQEDDDYLVLGIDEDLALNDDEALENGSEKTRVPIEINDNDDSDDNSGGERTRFKSERQITSTVTTRNTSAIPETLDAVTVRNPVKLTPKAGVRGGVRGGRGVQQQQRKFTRSHPNIHVNPHFRPRFPHGGPQMWNGGFPGQPQPPFQPPYPPSYGYQPPMQQQQWNDQGYYAQHGPPQFNSADNNYYGPPQDQFYPNQGVQQNYPPQPPAQPAQMGWGDNFYQGPPPAPHHNFPPPHFPPGPGPGPQMGPPRMRPPFGPPMRPPFNKNMNKPFQGKKPDLQGSGQAWGKGVRPQKRDQFSSLIKAPPVKQVKFDTAGQRLRSNLEEVKMVDSLPTPEAPVVEEEDEEMKAYRKKIEEQKKLREKILREKEEKRFLAAQQKLQESGQGAVSNVVSSEDPPGVVQPKTEFKLVRVRQADGKTVLKKLSLEDIKKLKKVSSTATAAPLSSCGAPSRIVAVENLSASTTTRQLEVMASKVGPVEKVELDSDKKTAVIRFIRIESAKDFVTKYQRKMVDLSMIGVKFAN